MNLEGKRITIVGMGRTALALTRLLLDKGAEPFVTENGPRDAVAEAAAILDAWGASWEAGGHTEAAFGGTDIVVPSPGVPPSIDPIAAAKEAGAAVMGEMELASRFCASRMIAVTGSNGKTTATELIAALIRGCGEDAGLAGNNAVPLSAAVNAERQPPYLVVEVSSYQLELARTFRPWIAAVLNVTPDHLARHGTLEAYAAVKGRIYARQGPGDHAIVNADDPRVAAMDTPAPRRLFSLRGALDGDGLWIDAEGAIHAGGSGPVAHADDAPLPGRHNLENVLAALSAIRAGGFPWAPALEALRAFRGVEHRIEPVGEVDGAAYYNDSKATNVDSLRVALESFERPIVLIAGGEGKGSDYAVLAPLVRDKVTALIVMGSDAPRIEAAFGGLVPTHRASGMEEAVRLAHGQAAAGGVVLLSPACASFDMYSSFEARGRHFKECVGKLRERAPL